MTTRALFPTSSGLYLGKLKKYGIKRQQQRRGIKNTHLQRCQTPTNCGTAGHLRGTETSCLSDIVAHTDRHTLIQTWVNSPKSG